MTPQGPGGVVSFRRKIGVTAKLGLAFAVLVVVMVIYGLVSGAAMYRLRSEIDAVVDVAQPMSAAAYEMEINTVGTGLGVMKYLHRPDPAYRGRFEDDRKEFEEFLAAYRRLARTARQGELAAEIESLFEEYERIGSALIERKDAQRRAFAELVRLVTEMENIKHAAPALDRSSSTGGKKAQLLAEIAGDLGVAYLTLTDAVWATSAASMQALDAEMTEVRDGLDAFARLEPTPDEAGWLRDMADGYGAAMRFVQSILEHEKSIGDDLARFIALRARLDDVLDGEVQALTALGLMTANADAQATVRWTFWFLVVGGAVGALVSGLGVLFLSRNIIGPVQRLAAATQAISDGDFAHRIQLPRQDELGRLASAFNTMTERLQCAHGRVNETTAQLEAEIAGRTRALALANDRLTLELDLRQRTEHDLRLAKDAAEAANQAKSLFLANMSHELRTPLNAILGFSEVLKNKMFGPLGSVRYEEYVTDINDSGAHLLRLINDVLDIARIESGRADLAEEFVDVAATVAGCVHLVDARATQKGIRLVTDMPPDLPALHADGTRLRQILTNLFDNAVKFTPDGGEIRVSAALSPAGGICLTVADTGIGIATADMPRVHEVFGQVDGSFSRSQGGAGLGLPLAKALAEKHGGTLTVESEPSVGTTVTVAFPPERTVPHAGEAANA
ncbi:MAG: ATP-binding protein [Dongiaceae bacterium]